MSSTFCTIFRSSAVRYVIWWPAMSTLSTVTTAVDCCITVGSAFCASVVVSRAVLSFALRLTFTTTDCWYRTVTSSPTFRSSKPVTDGSK